jgi:hypothetical protein
MSGQNSDIIDNELLDKINIGVTIFQKNIENILNEIDPVNKDVMVFSGSQVISVFIWG